MSTSCDLSAAPPGLVALPSSHCWQPDIHSASASSRRSSIADTRGTQRGRRPSSQSFREYVATSPARTGRTCGFLIASQAGAERVRTRRSRLICSPGWTGRSHCEDQEGSYPFQGGVDPGLRLSAGKPIRAPNSLGLTNIGVALGFVPNRCRCVLCLDDASTRTTRALLGMHPRSVWTRTAGIADLAGVRLTGWTRLSLRPHSVGMFASEIS